MHRRRLLDDGCRDLCAVSLASGRRLTYGSHSTWAPKRPSVSTYGWT
jgi:hypothetical protein